MRFFILSVHYRNPIKFTEELLETAKHSLERLETECLNLEHLKQASIKLDQDGNEWLEKVQSCNDRFEAEMDDDFNTANAIAVLFDLTKEANLYLQSKQTSTNVIQAFQDTMLTFFNVLG